MTERLPAEDRVAYSDVLSDDGTRLRAWTNDPDGDIEGPTVVLCNGLGTSPWAWPALLRPDCGVRVVSWNHRGTGGSERPGDPSRVEMRAHIDDALSVMDHFGVHRAVAMGWSIGVNTAFELAAEHPERVDGIFAVAGMPGDTFSTMLGPLRLPRPVARTVTTTVSRLMRLSGRAISPISTRLPVGPATVGLLSRTGFLAPVPDAELAARMVGDFLRTPVDWYFHLALGSSRHGRVSLRRIKVPVRFVAGSHDILAGARHMASAASRLEQAEYVELRGTHFIAVEQPEAVHELLLDFLDRVQDRRFSSPAPPVPPRT